MATKEFQLIIRHNTDDETQFNSVKDLLIKTAQEIYGVLLLASGPNHPKPDISLFSEDFVHGREDIQTAMKLVGDRTIKDKELPEEVTKNNPFL